MTKHFRAATISRSDENESAIDCFSHFFKSLLVLLLLLFAAVLVIYDTKNIFGFWNIGQANKANLNVSFLALTTFTL